MVRKIPCLSWGNKSLNHWKHSYPIPTKRSGTPVDTEKRDGSFHFPEKGMWPDILGPESGRRNECCSGRRLRKEKVPGTLGPRGSQAEPPWFLHAKAGFQAREWGRMGAARKCDDGQPVTWHHLLGLSLPPAGLCSQDSLTGLYSQWYPLT